MCKLASAGLRCHSFLLQNVTQRTLTLPRRVRQADVGVLVISSRKGEFETGFERGGQTREHAQLAKTLGVAKLVVVVNKARRPSSF